jgi:vacuolar-type H+-ATPase subunit E/Vma4
MSLHAILEIIRSSGDSKVLEIEKLAFSQASEISNTAYLDAERIQSQACASALEPASKERARIVHRAKLEALMLTGNARKELVDASLEQTHGRLEGMRADPIYARVLRQLLQESLNELNGFEGEMNAGQASAAYLECDPRDQALIESLLQEMGLDLPVYYTLECWGGLIARSSDGRVAAINTLEARLEKITPHLRRYLAGLFEEEPPGSNRDQVVRQFAGRAAKSMR